MMSNYPESKAVESGERGAYTYSIVKAPYGHYCGYVRFPFRFTLEDGYGGILTYVPVHGGITYAKQSADGSMVYGFDCAHAGDEDRPYLKSLEWLRHECRVLAAGVYVASKYEVAYLQGNLEQRADLLDKYHARMAKIAGRQFELQDNFGAMINLLCGKL